MHIDSSVVDPMAGIIYDVLEYALEYVLEYVLKHLLEHVPRKWIRKKIWEFYEIVIKNRFNLFAPWIG